MNKLPSVLTSSVIRSSHQGESHGGLYLVNLESESIKQILDWNDCNINWEGRGADRGLRGITFHGENIYIAASDEIFVYDSQFSLVNLLKNRYLKHCHEIYIYNDMLYLTSTGFDSILEYDINSNKFVRGFNIRQKSLGLLMKKIKLDIKPNVWVFDPESNKGPVQEDSLHINNVSRRGSYIYISGTGVSQMLCIENSKINKIARIPSGTHNAQHFKNGILMNNTSAGQVQYQDFEGKVINSFPIKKYEEKELLNNYLPKDHARQAFGRGLCTFGEDIIIGGSSPATISVYSFYNQQVLKTINLTMDIRNAIHGLEVWPFN